MSITIPGMLDPHVHLRGMDWAYKADFASETAAALAGGYWAVFDMPNTPPSTIDPLALNRKLTEFGQQAYCDWGVYFGAAMTGNERYYDQVSGQVCGLKIYNNSTTGDLLIDDQAVRERHYQHWPADKIITVHAEEDTVLDILKLVELYRKPTHFLHVSSAREFNYISAAKGYGLPVTMGVCPHHLYLTEADVNRLGAFAQMKPRLKTPADVQVLWDGLAAGEIDIVESDHAPHTIEEKRGPKTVYGVPGLETTIPLLGLAVVEGRLTWDQVADLVAHNPRRIFGVDCPPDTYTVIDPDAKYTITADNLHSRCDWTPFEGMPVQGKVTAVYIRGNLVYDGERVLAAPGTGRNLYAQS